LGESGLTVAEQALKLGMQFVTTPLNPVLNLIADRTEMSMAQGSQMGAMFCPTVLPERAVFQVAVSEFPPEVLRVSTSLSFERKGLVLCS
jgi:hypothetical protein